MEIIRNGSFRHKILVLWLGIILTLLSMSITIHTKDVNSIISVEEIKDLAQQIKSVEESLLNIKIDSEAWVEKRETLSIPWQRTSNYTSSTAWFSGISNNKARIDVHKEVLESSDGIALRKRESSYSVGFDGQYGRIISNTVGYSGRTFSQNEGQLLSVVPEELESAWTGVFAGKNFSLHFARIGENYRFSQIFQWAEDPKSKVLDSFEFTWEIFKGAKCIKIATKARGSQESWWFDPGRGFALLGHEYMGKNKDGTKRILFHMEVGKLLEVSPGIWWPTEVTKELNFPSPLESVEKNNYSRFVWHASKVVANDPHFDDSIFTITFPKGYLIDDKVNNTQYRVGGEDEAVVKEAISIEGRTLVRAIRKAEIVYFDEKDKYTDKWENISGSINLTENKYFTTPPILTASGEEKSARFTATVKGSGEAESVSVSIDKSGNITITGLK